MLSIMFFCIFSTTKSLETKLNSPDINNDTNNTVKVDSVSEPFSYGDFTWLNGNDRRHSALLDSKYFTGTFLLDVNYTASGNHPLDHTVVGSTALARDNEFQISCAAIGGDFHYDNVRARLLLQLGTRSTVVPRNDLSTLHGQFDLGNAYRYFSEANAGYHFNVLHGLNVDAGLFMSYVGLFSSTMQKTGHISHPLRPTIHHGSLMDLEFSYSRLTDLNLSYGLSMAGSHIQNLIMVLVLDVRLHGDRMNGYRL